jgi:hypothetical protein
VFKARSLDSGTKVQSRVPSPQRISVTYQSGLWDTHTSHAAPNLPSISNPSHHLLATDTTATATVSPLPKVGSHVLRLGYGEFLAPPYINHNGPPPQSTQHSLQLAPHTCLLCSLRQSACRTPFHVIFSAHSIHHLANATSHVQTTHNSCLDYSDRQAQLHTA